jgi:NAD(P)-dependent dehydrogenase (short-subunit alcohol dehydrogenase family)
MISLAGKAALITGGSRGIGAAAVKLFAQAGADDSPLRRSLQGSLDIAQRRRENFVKAGENLKVVEAELDRIEKQFALLLEQSSASTDPTFLTAKLDGVMQSVQETSQWLSDHAEIFGVMEEPEAPTVVPGAGPRDPARAF